MSRPGGGGGGGGGLPPRPPVYPSISLPTPSQRNDGESALPPGGLPDRPGEEVELFPVPAWVGAGGFGGVPDAGGGDFPRSRSQSGASGGNAPSPGTSGGGGGGHHRRTPSEPIVLHTLPLLAKTPSARRAQRTDSALSSSSLVAPLAAGGDDGGGGGGGGGGWTRNLSRGRSTGSDRSGALPPAVPGGADDGGGGGSPDDNGSREVFINDWPRNEPGEYADNAIRTTKYTLWNVVPKALFEQLRRVANLFFTAIAILSLVPGVSPTRPITNLLPLIVIVGFSLARDVWDDARRGRSDSVTNGRPAYVLSRRGSPIHAAGEQLTADEAATLREEGLSPRRHVRLTRAAVAVGDVVLVRRGETFPADLVLLATAPIAGGVAYVSTANLDGESNLKRVTLPAVLADREEPLSAAELDTLSASVTVQRPEPALHAFRGSMRIAGGEPLAVDAENMLLRDTTLRNTPYIYGAVLMTGVETKVALNMRQPPSKLGVVERQLNWIVIGLFLTLAAIVVVASVCAGVLQSRYGEAQWYMGDVRLETGSRRALISLGSFMILFNTHVPVSLFVTLEFVRLFQGLFMNADLKTTSRGRSLSAKSTNLNDQLGLISVVLSDKTGTLTENEMHFVAASVGGSVLDARANAQTIPAALVDAGVGDESAAGTLDDPNPARRLVLAMALCHNVVPEAVGGDDDGQATEEAGRSSKPGHAARVPARRARRLLRLGRRGQERDGGPSTGGGNGSGDRPSSAGGSSAFHSWSSSDEEGHGTGAGRGAVPSMEDPPSGVVSTRRSEATAMTVDPHAPIQYEGQSPDEVALVEAARDLGVILVDRSPRSVTVALRTPGVDWEADASYDNMDHYDNVGPDVTYEVLAELPFDSDRKRMSLVLRAPNGDVRLLTKGADTVMLPLLRGGGGSGGGAAAATGEDGFDGELSTEVSVAAAHLDRFAADGLRTLVFAQRRVSPGEFSAWHSRYTAARNLLDDSRDDVVAALSAEMEMGLELLAVTAVEDKLGYEVPESIAFLREAGIKIWVCTGDKRETAENIGYSARLLETNMRVVHVAADSDASCEGQLQAVLDSVGGGNFAHTGKTFGLTDSSSGGGSSGRGSDGGGDDAPRPSSRRARVRQQLSAHGGWVRPRFHFTSDAEGDEETRRSSRRSLPAILRRRRGGADGDGAVAGVASPGAGTGERRGPAAPTDGVDARQRLSLIIDGASLAFALNRHADLLMAVADRCHTVICCRVTGLQKALVVRMVRQLRGDSQTLAIGDGGNDVSMIQEAHIGVGIYGKEGTQAARASDFSISEFHHLRRLLAVHGRYSYVRQVGVINLSLYKAAAYTLTQVLFQIFCFFSATSLAESWLLTCFNLIFTAVTPLFFGLFEEDLKAATVLSHPAAYRSNRGGALLSWRSLFEYQVVYGVWHGAVIFFGLSLALGSRTSPFTSGRDGGLFLLSLAVTLVIVLTVHVRFALSSRTLNTLVLAGLVFGVVSPLLVVPIVTLPIVKGFQLEGILPALLSSTVFWLALPLLLATAFAVDFVVLVTRRLSKDGGGVVARLQRAESGAARRRPVRLLGSPLPVGV
ncbi:hypothetical protein I4F81_006915 [Pyropia yezoensis]|uniref:Uncharacterized protein n=1 Tax=Pyropia yezoensis TaxID=2788 RepID=A0ACC3C2H5_PYRYE|nr:hypothetical protein I4F81_006915 [Neopyropia yezoensis]